MNILPRHLPSEPVSLGSATRAVVIECVRKWAAGAALDERERDIIDDALALKRFELIETVFADREEADAES